MITLAKKCAVCPTCNRKMPVKKGVDRKLTEDLAKAERAITILRIYVQENRYGLRVACKSELERQLRATTDPVLLWRIYRRGEKKAQGYSI